jgi:tetratricopeptide (TPR) repeat protein
MCCLGLLYTAKGSYQAWYALHDSTWCDIEAGESAMKLGHYAEAQNQLLLALDKATKFESQRIPLPFPRAGLRDTVICCLGDLGRLYELQGKLPLAIDTYQRRLARCEWINGTDSYATQWCLIPLLRVYELQGNYEKAEPIFKRIASLWSHASSGTRDRVQELQVSETYAGFLRKLKREDEATALEPRVNAAKTMANAN